MKRYVAFYPSRPFWFVAPVAFDVPKAGRWFHDQMMQVVSSKETDRYEIRLHRDGRIALWVRDIDEKRSVKTDSFFGIISEYLLYLNSYFLILDSSSLQVDRFGHVFLHEVTPRDLIGMSWNGEKYTGENIAFDSASAQYQAGVYTTGYPSGDPQWDSRIQFRGVYSPAAIKRSFDLFEQMMSNKGYEEYLSLLAKAVSEYKVGNMEAAIVLSWFVMERLFFRFISNIPEITSVHRKTASQTLKILNDLGIFGDDLYGRLNSARLCRNSVVHNGRKSISEEDTRNALKSSADVIRLHSGIDLRINTGLTATGV